MSMPRWPVGHGAPEIGADVDALCLVFSRQETEAAREGRSVDDLMLLSEDARVSEQLAHGVFIAFEGWEGDPREVMFISACRHYLRELHAQWPYWLHFLAPVPEQWSVLLLCLADPVPVASAVPGQTAMSVDMVQIRRIVEGMLLPLNLLHQDMRLGEQQRQAVFERSMTAIREVLQ